MMMLKTILPNLYCLFSETLEKQGKTFVRFQEHYEGPEHKGKIFTIKEYKQWFRKTLGNGRYTYNTFYCGFNLPDTIFEPFLNGKFDPLSKEEKELLALVKDLPKPFYIIGVCSNEADYTSHLEHEIAHGFFYLNKKYKNYMLKRVNELSSSLLKIIKASLKENGYCKNVYNDEIQANMIHTNNPDIIKLEAVKKAKAYFKKLYDNHDLVTNQQ